MMGLQQVTSVTLKRLRNDRNLSLRQVSSTAFVSLSYLSELETSRKNPTPETLQALLSVYNLTPDLWYNELYKTYTGQA